MPAASGGDAERRTHRGDRRASDSDAPAVLAGALRSAAGAVASPRGPACCAVGVGRQHAREQPHRGDAVDERVVGLGVHRDAAVAQALDDVRLPQRPLPRQPGAVQPRAELEQLAHPARLGQRAVPDVVLDVELLVVHPHQLAGRARRAVRVLQEERRDLLDVAHLLVHLADVAAAGAVGLLEELEAADVHRHVAVLGEEEAGRGRVDQVHHWLLLRVGLDAVRGGEVRASSRPAVTRHKGAGAKRCQDSSEWASSATSASTTATRSPPDSRATARWRW